MPTETKLLGVVLAARGVRQAKIGPDGQPELDELEAPVMIDILELVFIEQRTGDSWVVPFTDEGIEMLKGVIAQKESSIIVPKPGTVKV